MDLNTSWAAAQISAVDDCIPLDCVFPDEFSGWPMLLAAQMLLFGLFKVRCFLYLTLSAFLGCEKRIGRIKKSKSKPRCRRSEVEHIIKDPENWSKKFWEKLLISKALMALSS